MKLVRTFHPVGHGAFYTEQFYENGECVFTAVYDCGGNPEGGIKKYVTDFCKNPHNLHKGEIDALFVSHLHSDHISGIKYLLDKNLCKKIFLPQLTRKQRLALLVENTVAATERLNTGPVQAIAQDDNLWTLKQCYSDSEFSSRIVRIPLIEEPIEETDNVLTRTLEECHGTLNVREGIRTAFGNGFEWIYFPMNIKDDVEIDFGDLLAGISDNDATEEMNFDRLAGICSNSDSWKTIKDNFETYITSKDANEYSMTVYSGLLKPSSRRAHIMDVECCHDCECNCDCEFPYCDRYRRRCYHRIEKPGCLYMGDFIAENHSIDKLIKSYGMYFEDAEIVQVPHHGSKRLHKDQEHYGFQLFDNCKVGVFSSKFGQYNGIPSPYVIQALKTNRVCPKIVTQKSYTMLKMIYHIM